MRALVISYLFEAFGIPNGPIKNMNIADLLLHSVTGKCLYKDFRRRIG